MLGSETPESEPLPHFSSRNPLWCEPVRCHGQRAADQGYGYLRTVDGPADLLHGSSQTSVEATANYPIQVGDQLRVSPRGRLGSGPA